MNNAAETKKTRPATSPASLRELLLAADDRRIERVETPEWAAAGVPHVWVKTLDATERLAMSRASGGDANPLGTLAAFAICDEAGRSIFTAADADALSRKRGEVLERVLGRYRAISGIDAAGEKDAEKNS